MTRSISTFGGFISSIRTVQTHCIWPGAFIHMTLRYLLQALSVARDRKHGGWYSQVSRHIAAQMQCSSNPLLSFEPQRSPALCLWIDNDRPRCQDEELARCMALCLESRLNFPFCDAARFILQSWTSRATGDFAEAVVRCSKG